MIVVTILGILAAMALPNFIRDVREASYRKNTLAITGLIEKARTQALASEVESSGTKVSPGGYGVAFDKNANKVILFVDDYHNGCIQPSDPCPNKDTCKVLVDYAKEQFACRVAPDGKFTAGLDGDTVKEVVEINDPGYVQMVSLEGTKLADGVVTDEAFVTLIFKPPYAETILAGSVGEELKSFALAIGPSEADPKYELTLNRVTGTPQITKITNQ